MATNLKVIRLLGDELMAEVISETETTITVKNPVRIVVVPTKADPKNPSVGFAPFCEWTDDKEFVISKNLFITSMEPLSVFINQYNTQFGGIVVPESKILKP